MADIYNDPNSPPAPAAPLPDAAPVGAEIPAGKTGEIPRRAAAGDVPEWQQLITGWVRENQILAMAGGFALGVFLGVLMRD